MFTRSGVSKGVSTNGAAVIGRGERDAVAARHRHGFGVEGGLAGMKLRQFLPSTGLTPSLK